MTVSQGDAVGGEALTLEVRRRVFRRRRLATRLRDWSALAVVGFLSLALFGFVFFGLIGH